MNAAGLPTQPSVLVVGAGWAGLSAAVRLVQAGHRVTVIDSAPQAGGRARTQSLVLDGQALKLDNGQHLLVGAYSATLQLLQDMGVAPHSVLTRQRLNLCATDGLRLRAQPWPAPFHLLGALLTARGLSVRERGAIVRACLGLRRHGVPAVEMTVRDWLAYTRQPAVLIERFWQPLCLGALNTSVTEACAASFARVLLDTLMSRAQAADFLLPQTTLGAVLPEPALAWLQRHHSTLLLRTTCRSLQRSPDGVWHAHTDRGVLTASQVVLAVPPHHVLRLLDPAIVPTALQQSLAAFEYESIATVWLSWRQTLTLPDTFMLHERPQDQAPGQWLFGRVPPPSGPVRALAGVVISGCTRYGLSPAALATAVAQQVATQCQLPPPAAARAVIERHATIRCTPQRPRLDASTLLPYAPSLYLAGDWVWHTYPATLESAVRSGQATAQAIGAAAPWHERRADP